MTRPGVAGEVVLVDGAVLFAPDRENKDLEAASSEIHKAMNGCPLVSKGLS